MVKGYKALDENMCAINGNGMQYELGKLYIAKGKIIPCKNGFHFCKRLEYLNCYYDIADSRIFEVEASGEINTNDEEKFAAEKIKLTRELTKQEINDYFRENQEKFIKSKNEFVRAAVAKQGYGLDRLINDKDWSVRRAVAEQGYGLETLIHDEDWHVRREVARQGYGLKTLIHDKHWSVRKAVAKQGYGLEILVHDEDCNIRAIAGKKLKELDKKQSQ